jgi:HET-S-like prion-inhibition and propagation protein
MGGTCTNGLKKLCIGRQKGTGLSKKAKWVLYEQSHFETLVKDITDLVNNLVELFPATQQIQQLCDQEVAELSSQGVAGLPILQDIANSQDKELAAFISKELEYNGSTTWINNDNTRVG